MIRNTFGRKRAHILLWIFVYFSLLLFTPHTVFAQTPPPNSLVGTWGYTVLGHAANSWFTWKTEAGTMTFYANGTAVSTYMESANTCPDGNYCKAPDTMNHTYTANADGTFTIDPLDGGLRVVVSDDGKTLIMDGASFDNEQMLVVGVKMDGTRTFTNADINGDYYTGAYEYDALGTSPPNGAGQYRVQSVISSMSNGNITSNGTLNGDGTIVPVTNQPGTYSVSSDGSMTVSGVLTGYTGDGKLAIFSNAKGGTATDFASFAVLKKADKAYSTSDLQGTWAMAGFGDNGKGTIRSGFGTVTCDSSGNCLMSLKVRKSNNSSSYFTTSLPMSVQPDGSCNGFYFANETPHYSGAIGSNGNTMLLIMNTDSLSTNDRVFGIALKCSSCSSLIATNTISGTIKDSTTQQGIQGVTVTVKGASSNTPVGMAATDASGAYSVAIVSETGGGDYTVAASKAGYNDYSQSGSPITLTTVNPQATLNFSMAVATGGGELIPFSTGWNFISFPKLPQNVSVESVFSDVSPNIKVVWSYDNSAKGWQKYKPNAPGNTISIVESGKGYWVYMDASGNINMAQWSAPPSTTTHLYNGWNLVGFLGPEGATTGDALATIAGKWIIVWTWNNGEWCAKHFTALTLPASIQPLSNFYQGKANWIRMVSAGDWSFNQSGALVSIAVTPANPSVTTTATRQFKATGTYSDNTTRDITSSVTWSSGATSIATISANAGLATGVAAGPAVITATSGAKSGSTTLTVTARQVHIVSDGVRVPNTSFGAGATANLATFNLNMAGNGKLVATATINPLTFGPSPAEYGGKNHTLHVNVLWNVLVNGTVIGTFQQTAEQNIIQFQIGAGPTTTGLKAITLQAVNSSYWSLDDAPFGTTPVGTNDFSVVFSAMELEGIVSDGVRVPNTSFGAGATANLATFNLNMAGNGKLVATATINPLTFGPSPAEYGGKNHTLHVNVLWNVLVNGTVIGTFQQTAEQNIIQIQIGAGPTTAGLKAITLQAVNSSYWSLDDAPFGTTPVGTNDFSVVFSAMELEGIVSDGVRVPNTSFGAGATANLATFNLNMAGNGKLVATATINPLTFGPSPAEYGGKNHTLHVNVLWNVLVNGTAIGSFQQTAEQNIIQFQIGAGPTTTGLKAITLQAVNSSYWSLDDAPFGTTPVGTNDFSVVLSAMELEGT